MPLDWALRYAPIVSAIRERRPQSILEVGSGPDGVAYYLRNRRVVGTDIAFGKRPLPNLRAVLASAEALPFRDRAFDLVVSSDMMEHLPEQLRERAMRELLRVSHDCAVVGFPSGPTAERHDRALERLVRRLRATPPRWLAEHLQHPYPTGAAIIRLVPDAVWRTRVVRNTNWRLHLAVVALSLHWRLSRLLDRLGRPGLVAALSPLLNRGRTYREILVLERVTPEHASATRPEEVAVAV